MGIKLIIPGTLPNLNDYIKAERTHRQKAAAMKRETEEYILWRLKGQLRGARFRRPVLMHYSWYEPDRRRDKDNISSFGRKCIQDALVKARVLENDGWSGVQGFSDAFYVDKKNPRIEITIEEESNGNE